MPEQSQPYPVYGAGERFVEDVESGDRRLALLALRKHIAERIADGIAARDLAALSRQLRDITKELEGLDGADAGTESPEDELARRRAAVLSAAGVQPAEASGDARAARG